MRNNTNNKSVLTAVAGGVAACFLCIAIIALFPSNSTNGEDVINPDYNDYSDVYDDTYYEDDEYYDNDYYEDDDYDYDGDYDYDYDDYYEDDDYDEDYYGDGE